MLPYSTYSNGAGEYDIMSPLTSGKYVWVEVESKDPSVSWSSSSATVDAVNWNIAGGTYVVSSPRNNFAQGEVGHSTSATSWMGGGSGEQFAEYWLGTSGVWSHWGSMSVCNNSPYWATQASSSQWSNGGY
jgi:hypothetical protein